MIAQQPIGFIKIFGYKFYVYNFIPNSFNKHYYANLCKDINDKLYNDSPYKNINYILIHGIYKNSFFDNMFLFQLLSRRSSHIQFVKIFCKSENIKCNILYLM